MLILMSLIATAAIFTGALTPGAPRWTPDLVGIYNGTDSDGPYQMGAATSSDGGVTWTLAEGNPVLTLGSGGQWDDEQVKDPYLLWDGSQFVLYYSGYDGSVWQTGRATADAIGGPWTKYGSNPVLTVGGASAFDEDFAGFPVVLYEADEDPAWKMWYSAIGSSNVVTIGYAYSSDGLSWTKHGQVLTAGSGGSWDDVSVGPAAVTRQGDTYHLFYHGTQDASNQRSQVGLVTFTDPEGTYTRHGSNPLIRARFNDSGTSQPLTANRTAGGAQVSVASTAAYNVGEAVVLADGNSQTETRTIASIDSGTQVTLDANVTVDFTTAQNAILRPLAYNAVGARSIHHTVDGWVMYGEAIQPVEDLTVGGSKLREGGLRWTAPAITGPWSYDYEAGLLLPMYPDDTGWSSFSNEHLTVLPASP